MNPGDRPDETAHPDGRFVCRECDRRLRVNDSVAAALVEHGCVICTAPVSPDEFTTG